MAFKIRHFFARHFDCPFNKLFADFDALAAFVTCQKEWTILSISGSNLACILINQEGPMERQRFKLAVSAASDFELAIAIKIVR